MNRYIEIQDMSTYFNRLIWKPSKRPPFIYDFLNGDGNELADKFWNTKSSSRLAFDMWSWLIDHPSVVSMSFERKLPSVIASRKGPADKTPNMDVFVQTSDTVLFVESKYTEIASAYYKDATSRGLSKAYWAQEDHGGVSASKRFYGERFIFNCFSKFVDEIQYLLDEIGLNDEYKWFDAKQETTHLFGIIFGLLYAGKYEDGYHVNPQPDRLKGKKAMLMNVVCNMLGDVIDEPEKDSLPEQFRTRAEKMVNTILSHYGYEKDMFSYSFMSYESLLLQSNFLGRIDFTSAKSYGFDALVRGLFDDYSWAENFRRGEHI